MRRMKKDKSLQPYHLQGLQEIRLAQQHLEGRPLPVSKNKHAFLDPPGWSIFPRPALREILFLDLTNLVRKRDALQNLCCDCASGCVVHWVGGYSSLIVYRRGLPV